MRISNIYYHLTSPRSLSAGISVASLAYQAFQAARPHFSEASNYFWPRPREIRSKIHGGLDLAAVLDMTSFALAFCQLIRHYGLFYSRPTVKRELILAGLLAAPAVSALPTLRWLNHFHWNRYCPDISELRSERIDNDVTISWNRPGGDKRLQGFLIVNAAYHFGLARFSRFKLLSGMTAALSLYRLYRVTQQRWVKYEVTVVTDAYHHINKIRFSIFLGLVPLQSPSDDNCTMCYEGAPTHYFCEYHALHPRCMVDWINSQKDQILDLNAMRFSRRTYTNRGPTYGVSIPKSNLPGCASRCETSPIYAVEATCYNQDSPQNTTVILTDASTSNQR